MLQDSKSVSSNVDERLVACGQSKTLASLPISGSGNAFTPANETVDLVSLNMAVPVRSVSAMHHNPKTLNHSGVYIYNYVF